MKTDLISLLYISHGLSPVLGFIAHYLVVKDVPRQNHFIFAYLVVCFCADGFSYFQLFTTPIIFNIHDIAQFTIIMAIYVLLFNQRAAWYLVISIILYVIGITATITLIGLNVYHNYMWALSALLISVVCVVYMSVLNARPKEFANNKDLYNTLLMNSSFLFYFLSTFAFFLFSNMIFEKLSDEGVRITWVYHNTVGLIKNIGLAIAIFLTGKAKVNETVPDSPANNTNSIRL
jgi:hypothetical protein